MAQDSRDVAQAIWAVHGFPLTVCGNDIQSHSIIIRVIIIWFNEVKAQCNNQYGLAML